MTRRPPSADGAFGDLPYDEIIEYDPVTGEPFVDDGDPEPEAPVTNI